jgi:hypothetical protein
MPARRGKGGGGAKASVSTTLTPEEEELNLNRQLLLQDMDKSVEAAIKDMQTTTDAVCKSIVSMFHIRFLKMTPGLKALTLDQYVEKVPIALPALPYGTFLLVAYILISVPVLFLTNKIFPCIKQTGYVHRFKFAEKRIPSRFLNWTVDSMAKDLKLLTNEKRGWLTVVAYDRSPF